MPANYGVPQRGEGSSAREAAALFAQSVHAGDFERSPEDEDEFGPYRRHRAYRHIQFNDKVQAMVGGIRLAILAALTRGECSVHVLSERLGRPTKIISRELVVLQTHGMVVWVRRKNEHIYRLTGSLQFAREGNAVRFLVLPSEPEPLWAVVHIEEGRGDLPAQIGPPDHLLVPSNHGDDSSGAAVRTAAAKARRRESAKAPAAEGSRSAKRTKKPRRQP